MLLLITTSGSLWKDMNSHLDSSNAIWDDGEWISWGDINDQIQYKEWGAKYPKADLSLVPIFEDLMALAEQYNSQTGKHLQVYGDIGELFGAITHGIKLHKNYAQGSDGRVGNDFIEVKTITPFKKNDAITVKLSGNFNKLLIVKINEDHEISSELIDRSKLPKTKANVLKINWSDIKNT